MRKALSVLALAALLLPDAAWAEDIDAEAAAAIGRSVGDSVYGASFKNMADGMEGLAPYKDDILVLYFWATWCAPCRIEAVDLNRLKRSVLGHPVSLVAIAMSNGDEVRRFVSDHGLTYKMLYGGPNAIALTTALGNGIVAVPYFVLIRDGKIIDAFHGDRTPEELEQTVAGLVRD